MDEASSVYPNLSYQTQLRYKKATKSKSILLLNS